MKIITPFYSIPRGSYLKIFKIELSIAKMLQYISGLVAQVINYQGSGLIKCGSEERRFESSQDLFSLNFLFSPKSHSDYKFFLN